jgi:hypothetical protein
MRYPMSSSCRIFMLFHLPYGREANVQISYNVTPKLHTSDAVLYLRKNIASGAVQRRGTEPPLDLRQESKEKKSD